MPIATMSRLPRFNALTHTRPVSEHALVSAVADALRLTGYGQLRCLDLRCHGDSVILAGRVPTYFLKQIAQNAALGVPGVDCVDNEIEVVSEECRPWEVAR